MFLVVQVFHDPTFNKTKHTMGGFDAIIEEKEGEEKEGEEREEKLRSLFQCKNHGRMS